MREYYRKKLNKLLSVAGDEEFIQLLWATHALQSDYAHAARNYIRPETIPDGAITTKMISPHFVQKWEIETLANELMTIPKLLRSKNGRKRTLHWDHFQVSIQCAKWLRKLENAEFRIQKRSESIFVEMARIASRQFDWQRGYANIPQFYRNAFVYGQGECASYFEHQHGISFNRFSQIGFMLYVSFTISPVVRETASWAELGVTWDEIERVLALISLPFHDAAKLARTNRKGIVHTADRPSILRQAPCLRFGDQGERIRAPLPELILARITSGVFYDVIGGEGPVRDDYGKRFEDYCFRYLSDALPNYEWESESNYRKKPNTYSTPDVLCNSNNWLDVAYECKATRMSQVAMFGRDPLAARGYEDLAKAVFQLWRFFSHCRRGYAQYNLTGSTIGVVLTLDNWLVMADTLRESVLQEATDMTNVKDPEITDTDRKPIVFLAISELERILSTATESSFKKALSAANSEKYKGWRLDGIHSDLLKADEQKERRYPFTDDIGILLPWWDEMDRNDIPAQS